MPETPETSGTDRRAERLYLAIYERVVAKSDYLQPDDRRQMLPEAVIIGAVVSVIAGVLSGITQGFLGKVGENLADKTAALWKQADAATGDAERTGAAAVRASDQPRPEELVAIMAEALPTLQGPTVRWDEVAAHIALQLTRRGMRFASSQELAREIVLAMQREIGPAR
jgi:hypothetical protein